MIKPPQNPNKRRAARWQNRHAILPALPKRTARVHIFLRFSRINAEPRSRFQMPDDPARSVADHQKCERKQGVVMDWRLLSRIDDRGFLQHLRDPDDAADGGGLK